MVLGDRPSIGWFLGVGGLAGLVHYVTALTLHSLLSASPAMANLVGFACAFPVSYFGHRTLSFAGAGVPHRKALPRLFAVSAFAFVVNQALLLSLLTWTTLPLWIALALVLFVVAFSTYVLSRGWVFARSRKSRDSA